MNGPGSTHARTRSSCGRGRTAGVARWRREEGADTCSPAQEGVLVVRRTTRHVLAAARPSLSGPTLDACANRGGMPEYACVGTNRVGLTLAAPRREIREASHSSGVKGCGASVGDARASAFVSKIAREQGMHAQVHSIMTGVSIHTRASASVRASRVTLREGF